MYDSEKARIIATRAENLQAAFLDLDAAKFAHSFIRPERKQRPTPGPQTPGDARAVHLGVDITIWLGEIAKDIRNHIEPSRALVDESGVSLCRWIQFNAALIAELDWADDVADALLDYTRRIDRFLGGPPTVDLNRPEPRQYAPAICQRLSSMGYRVNPETLRQWVARSSTTPHPISVEILRGKSRYLLTEILDYLTWRESKKAAHNAQTK